MKETTSGENEGLKKMPSAEQMNNLILKNNLPNSCISNT